MKGVKCVKRFRSFEYKFALIEKAVAFLTDNPEATDAEIVKNARTPDSPKEEGAFLNKVVKHLRERPSASAAEVGAAFKKIPIDYRVWFIDILFKDKDGTPQRYRRDAKVQTKAAATTEWEERMARRVRDGSPYLPGEVSATSKPATSKKMVESPRVEAGVDESPAVPTAAPRRRLSANGRSERAEKLAAYTFAQLAHPGPFVRRDGTFEPSNVPPMSTPYWTEYAIRKLEHATRVSYGDTMRTHLLRWFGDLVVVDINADDVRAFDADMATKGYPPSTRQAVLAVVRSVLCRYCVEVGIFKDPPPMPRLPKVPETEPMVPSTVTIQQIIDATPHAALKLAILLALCAGLRTSEIRGLRVCDVDFEANKLTVRKKIARHEEGVPKSKKPRVVPLVPMLRAALEAAAVGKGPQDRISTNVSGSVWGQGGMYEMYGYAAAKLGLVLKVFHHLRHAFCSALFAEGVDARTVQELMGHSDLTITERYAHTNEPRKHAGIERLAQGLAKARASTQPAPAPA